MIASAMQKRQEKRRGTMWEQRSDNFTLTAREGLCEALDRGNEGRATQYLREAFGQ